MGQETAEDGKLDAVQSASVDDYAAGNPRLCVQDLKTGIMYLVDTGAYVSVIPASKVKTKQKQECTYKLFTANNSEIKTYGVVTIELNLGLSRRYKWSFIVCNVHHRGRFFKGTPTSCRLS